MVGFMREREEMSLEIDWDEFKKWESESARLLQEINNVEKKREKKEKKQEKKKENALKDITAYSAMLSFALMLYFTENVLKSLAMAIAVYAVLMLFASVRRLLGALNKGPLFYS